MTEEPGSLYMVQLLRGYVPTHAPLVGLWLLAGIYALIRWRRHPRMSAMLLTAMVLLISLVVCDVVLMLMINSYAEGIPDQFAFYLTSLTTVMVALQTAAWALVLLAVFSGRQYPQGRELLAKPRGAVPDLPADAICE